MSVSGNLTQALSCLGSCGSCATKAELNALRAELSRVTKGNDFNKAVRDAMLPLLGAYATKESISTLKALADGNAQWIKVNGNAVAKLPQLQAQVNNTAAQTAAVASGAVTATTVASMISAALAGLGIGTFIKQLIDQKANQIQFGRQQLEIEANTQAANDAFSQAIKARQEARTVQAEVQRAIANANRAETTANQAIALSNQQSAANAFAQEAARKANAAAANAQARASAIQKEAENSIKNLQAQAKKTEETYKQEITRVKVEQTVNRIEQTKQTQQEINRVKVEQTLQRAEQLKQVSSLDQRQTQVETNVRTTLKAVTTQVQQIEPLKTTAKQLESSLNTKIETATKTANTQITQQLQEQVKVETQKLQQQNIKMNEEQFQKIDTKLTNVLATAGIAAATATIVPQILDKVTKITPAPCLAPVLVPPVDAKVSTNIGLTNTLQGVVVAQNAVLQGTANAINTTVQATNGIVRAMQPVLNTVSNGLNTLTTFTQTAWRATKMDKILNLLNTALLLHNALMLSNNIGYTLIEIVENTLAAIGIKDEEGNEIDVGAFIGTSISNFIKGAIGESLYTNLSTTFKRANRIYQSAANVFWLARSMMDSVREISEIAAENIGVIGNALKKDGVVDENSYPRMPEEVNGTSRFLQRLENISDAVDTVEEVSDEARNISEDLADMREQQQEFKKSLDDWKKVENKKADDAKKAVDTSPQPQTKDEVEADG